MLHNMSLCRSKCDKYQYATNVRHIEDLPARLKILTDCRSKASTWQAPVSLLPNHSQHRSLPRSRHWPHNQSIPILRKDGKSASPEYESNTRRTTSRQTQASPAQDRFFRPQAMTKPSALSTNKHSKAKLQCRTMRRIASVWHAIPATAQRIQRHSTI